MSSSSICLQCRTEAVQPLLQAARHLMCHRLAIRWAEETLPTCPPSPDLPSLTSTGTWAWRQTWTVGCPLTRSDSSTWARPQGSLPCFTLHENNSLVVVHAKDMPGCGTQQPQAAVPGTDRRISTQYGMHKACQRGCRRAVYVTGAPPPPPAWPPAGSSTACWATCTPVHASSSCVWAMRWVSAAPAKPLPCSSM